MVGAGTVCLHLQRHGNWKLRYLDRMHFPWLSRRQMRCTLPQKKMANNLKCFIDKQRRINIKIS